VEAIWPNQYKNFGSIQEFMQVLHNVSALTDDFIISLRLLSDFRNRHKMAQSKSGPVFLFMQNSSRGFLPRSLTQNDIKHNKQITTQNISWSRNMKQLIRQIKTNPSLTHQTVNIQLQQSRKRNSNNWAFCANLDCIEILHDSCIWPVFTETISHINQATEKSVLKIAFEAECLTSIPSSASGTSYFNVLMKNCRLHT